MQNQGLRVVLLYLILAGWEYLSTSALGLLLLCPILKKSWGRRGWDEKLIVIDWARKGTYTAIDRGFLVRLVYLQRMLWESNMRVIAWIWKRFVWLTYTATLFYDFVKWEYELWCLPNSSSPKIKKSTSINNHIESYETYVCKLCNPVMHDMWTFEPIQSQFLSIFYLWRQPLWLYLYPRGFFTISVL